MGTEKEGTEMEKIKQYVNNKTVMIGAVLLCIAIAAVTAVRLNHFWAYRMEINLDEMSGSMHTDEEGNKYIVDYYDFDGNSDYALYGPYMTLGKGYYTVEIDYDTDYECRMDVHSNKFADYVVSSDIILKEHSTHKRFNIRIKDDVDDFELRVKYNGIGALKVYGITITENTIGIKTSAFVAFLTVIVLTACYLLRQKIKQNQYTLAALAAITVLSCVPEMTQGMCMGHDGAFHLLRIEGLAEGLRSGIFPVRMQSNWMEGYGYPVSIYYGDILLYIPALLRIVGFSVTQSYKAYLFLINLGTVLVSYGCFHKIVKNNRAALLGTVAYSFATYRLTNVYVRLAVGEYSAILFLPLVFLAVYQIYTENTLEFRNHMKNALLLAVGMTGLVQTHLISVATVSIMIAFVCIVMIKKTLRRKTLMVFALAVVMTIAVNLFFLVPFIDYSKNVPVEVLNDSEETVANLIQGKGAYVSQYFMLYQKAFGASGKNIGDRMAITPGIVLMTALFGGIYGCMRYRDKRIKFMTLMSVLLLWMSSNLFPWNFMINHVPFMGWISKIQFPWRFLPIAQVFLSLLLCMLLVKIEEGKRERTELALLVLLIVTTAQMFSGVIQERSYVEKYDAAGIDSFSLVNGEYVRADTEIDLFDGQVYTNNAWAIGDYTRDGKCAIMKCETVDGADDAWIEFPIINYKNYAAYGTNGIPLKIVDGENNVVRVMLPGGYQGSVTVTYEIPPSYKAADICSMIAVAAIAVIMLLSRKKQAVKIIEMK